jgi:TatD DNase family protein
MTHQPDRKDAAHATPSAGSGRALTDSHAHLTSPKFDADLQAVLERAGAVGVQRFLCPGYDLQSSRAAVALAGADPRVLAAVGVHPHDARLYDDATEAVLESMLASRQAVAAGEMGLDYYYENSPRDVQRRVLRRQLRMARRQGVPVVLHNRDSDEDMAEILEAEAVGLRAVLHGFNGSPLLVEVGCRLNLYFGIGGFLTFKKHPLASCVGDLPRRSLLLETDSPYMSPHPMRGRRNEPAHVEIVARRLAEVLDLSVVAVAALTTENFERFLQES